MSRIYLAALYSRRDEMSIYAELLREDGHTITSRWVDGQEEGMTNTDIAILDYDDVKRADTLILFTLKKGTLYMGGGRHTEFGLAYAWEHDCFVVGDREQVFCHLPLVTVVPDFRSVRKILMPTMVDMGDFAVS